ncbi:hypothetical protein ACFQ4C_07330 [Larkinella insperata]|uniref:Uncharacterized protein n=1 Tax=Larkinella insperata TaxID=332158 RepID=A0ABW3Q685_9BACT
MPTYNGETDTVFDAIAPLFADLKESPVTPAMDRLRSVVASALRAQLRTKQPLEAVFPLAKHGPQVVSESIRTNLTQELERTDELPAEALLVARRDNVGQLFSGQLTDQLTGLAPGERLGPFATQQGTDVWFDVFFAANRLEVREAGVMAPALVITRATAPVIGNASATIGIEAGTVWIRGNLINSALPPNSFVGIRVKGGVLELNQVPTVTGNGVEVPAPLQARLQLSLAGEEATPVEGACLAAQTSVTLPDTLTVRFDAGVTTAQGDPGKAESWGQPFAFDTATGAWSFIERLWTVVLEYELSPRQFNADAISADLIHAEGVGNVQKAGLGLPVVVAANPAVLGETSTAAGWYFQIDKLLARWYSPETRLHQLADSWIGMTALGATIVAEHIAPLNQPVTHTYDLWTLAGGSKKRLPWHQRYAEPFLLFYRCHILEGEHLLVQGQAEIALDRPLTTQGIPVPTPTTQGLILLHRLNGSVMALLGGTVQSSPALYQFALRNALLWTAAPTSLMIRGELSADQRIDAGSAQLLLGVYGWAPTLPDPYVFNGFIQRPKVRQGRVQGTIQCRLTWSGPENGSVSFEGTLGPNLSVDQRPVSAGEPRPAPGSQGDPEVGLTQVEQQRLTFDRKGQAQWKEAQTVENQTRGHRLEIAQQENKKSLAMVDGYLREVLGPAPNLLLLDVSTNQDLLGVGLSGRTIRDSDAGAGGPAGDFTVSDLSVHSQVATMRVVTLPQVQWEPVRTLDADQNIMTMGWFPTPLASATDGGATHIGARSQKLMPIIPEDALQGTFDAFRDGTAVGVRTTFPFGLIGAIRLQPKEAPQRPADLYDLNRPTFPDEQSVGGIQITAQAEGGRPANGGISPMFAGQMRQLLNGVDLTTGAPLGLSVLGETLQPAGSVETVFNNDMAARPRVPVTRIDLSGYGGSNFSDWNNPFAAFAEAAKVQFRLVVGRTILEIIKVNSVLHPWGVRVTRSVTIERRPGGGVIRRDSGWQAITPGIFDYRYFDPAVNKIVVAPYEFDAGVFRGLFNIRFIRPAPGTVFSHGAAQLVPYYFDADVALEGVPGRTASQGILGYLQIAPNGTPAGADAIQALIAMQGPIGGPTDTWMNFGGSGLPFRAQRVEVGLANNGGTPLFVATVRGVPKLPETGAWSVAVRPVASVPPNGGEAVPVAENRGVPVIRRYPVAFPTDDDTVFHEPRLAGTPGDYRLADAADLLTPTAPANDYALLQSTPTHALFFPRPFVPAASAPRIESGHRVALADIFARSTSKGAFPPPANTLELNAGLYHFNVSPAGKLALSAPVLISNPPNSLRMGGTPGHGSSLFYDKATLKLDLAEDHWNAEFTGLQMWSDISGLERLTGSEMRIVGSTTQRPQIAEIKSLMLQEIEEILQYIPVFGERGVQGPVDLGATNAKHELKVDVLVKVNVPPPTVIATFPAGSGVVLTLFVKQSTGIDLATGGPKASATFGANLEGKVPLLSVGVAAVFLVIAGEVTFSLTSVSGSVTAEKLDLMAFVGVGVEGKIGPFKAYAFLGVGFVLAYDAITSIVKYGGIVALEAGVDLVIVKVKIRAELKGLVYSDAAVTKCDYSGLVKIQVDIFLIFSISASYQVTETTTFS